MKSSNESHISEIRQDIVTGDWVVIASRRSQRPEAFAPRETADTLEDSIHDCVFENPEKTGQESDLLVYRDNLGDWTLRVFPNKYPAVLPDVAAMGREEGPYFAMPGVGSHEVVVYRDHFQDPGSFAVLRAAEMMDAFQERYLDLMCRKNIRYISIIHNHGRLAGASITHPHSQIFAIPVISPYIRQELEGAQQYARATQSCAYCTALEYDMTDRRRVVFENAEFIAICPFASRSAFEVWVLPKVHQPYFERIKDAQKVSLAEVFSTALRAISTTLHKPDYNFYLHTAPCDGKDYAHFHWHWEILPKTSTWAGFELSTGVEISTMLPERAAELLRHSTQRELSHH